MMRRRISPVILVTGLSTAALSAHAQDGDIAAGHAFGREACNACHVVEAEQRAPRLIVIGPAFRISPTPAASPPPRCEFFSRLRTRKCQTSS